MMTSFTKPHRLLCSALLAVFLSTVVISSSNAETDTDVNEVNDPAVFDLDPDQEVHEDPFVSESEATLDNGPESISDGSFSPMNVRVSNNPYKCAGSIDNVHKSGGTASLHTKIVKCNRKIAELANGAEIMKAGWFGQWHRRVFVGKEKKNAYQLTTVVKKVCGNNSLQSYRGNGYHRMTHGGKLWTSRTSSPKVTRFACDA